MSKSELLAKIELLNEYEAMLEELRTETEAIRDEIKTEMTVQNTEEMTVGKYIIRWTSILSNRFDSTAFKKVMQEIYKAYTKQPENEVGKRHHAYDALMVERNQLARELATWKKVADDLAKERILDEQQQRGKK